MTLTAQYTLREIKAGSYLRLLNGMYRLIGKDGGRGRNVGTLIVNQILPHLVEDTRFKVYGFTLYKWKL